MSPGPCDFSLHSLAQIRWSSADTWPQVAVVVLAVVAVLAWFYLPQLRGIASRRRLVLPLFRFAALGALAISLLRPTVMRPRLQEERGSVVMLVDTSASMSVRDTARTPASCIALADALGFLPAGLRQTPGKGIQVPLEQLRNLLKQAHRARVDLGYARVAGRGMTAAQDRLNALIEQTVRLARAQGPIVDELASDPKLKKALAELSAVSPPDRVRDAWISEVQMRVDQAAAMVDSLQSQSDIQLFQSNSAAREAAQHVASLSRLELARRALVGSGALQDMQRIAPVQLFAVDRGVRPVGSSDLDTLSASGAASRLDTAPTEASRFIGDQPIRAIVLISDGRRVQAPVESPTAFSKFATAPTFTVDVAAQDVKDVSLASVDAPSDVFVGETFTATANISSSIDHAQANVFLETDQVRTSRATAIDANEMTRVAFTAKLNTAGIHRVGLEVEPVAGEATDRNNRAVKWIKVHDDPVRVALISGWTNRDFQLVRRSLAASPAIRLTAQAFNPVNGTLALNPQQIRELDVLILNAVPASTLSAQQWNAVNDLVRRRGGSVVLVAGASDLPAGYDSNVLASGLLPFTPDLRPAWRVWPGERPAFRFMPAPGASVLPLLQIDPQLSSADAAWQSLSGVYRYLPVTSLKPSVRPLLLESDSASPVLTEMRLGRGRAFFLGVDETWRWRGKAAPVASQDRFWLQLVRYAGGETYAVRSGDLALDVSPLSAQPGEPIRLRARLFNQLSTTTAPATQPVMTARMIDGAQNRSTPINFQPDPDSGLFQFSAEISAPEAGEYVLSADAETVHGASVSVPMHVEENLKAELGNVSGDARWLQSLAESTGGQYLPIDQLRQLPKLIAEVSLNRSNLVETRLWDSWLLFAFVVACLGAEWALRKQLGML